VLASTAEKPYFRQKKHFTDRKEHFPTEITFLRQKRAFSDGKELRPTEKIHFRRKPPFSSGIEPLLTENAFSRQNRRDYKNKMVDPTNPGSRKQWWTAKKDHGHVHS
jgi:hypothetical protein